MEEKIMQIKETDRCIICLEQKKEHNKYCKFVAIIHYGYLENYFTPYWSYEEAIDKYTANLLYTKANKYGIIFAKRESELLCGV